MVEAAVADHGSEIPSKIFELLCFEHCLDFSPHLL